MPKAKILLVDDEAMLRESLTTMLTAWGYEVASAPDGETALQLISDQTFDLVISDILMPGISGLELLETARRTRPELTFIMISAHNAIAAAVQAVKAGAFNYLNKPLRKDELQIHIQRALKQQQDLRELASFRKETQAGHGSPIIGKNPALTRIMETVTAIADSPSTVLVQGESGTGKELVARAIHTQSSRRNAPFVTVDCGSLPENLLESELFGHEKGSFTGAIRTKQGLFQTADKGTLFLDEIGELPLALQAKLLRALQHKIIRRVGGTADITCDVRVIAATNRVLADEVTAGNFREDLFYRIKVITIQMPPLRERAEDIPLLMDHFIGKYNMLLNKDIHAVNDTAKRALMRYPWPGNIRELENAIELAVNLAKENIITESDLPVALRQQREAAVESAISLLPDQGNYHKAKEELLNHFEHSFFTRLLRQCNWKIGKAAEACGLDRKNLRTKLKKLNISKPE